MTYIQLVEQKIFMEHLIAGYKADLLQLRGEDYYYNFQRKMLIQAQCDLRKLKKVMSNM